jgi:hypothetical protein
VKRIAPNGEEIPISDIGLDVSLALGNIRRTPWRLLILEAIGAGRLIVREAAGWGIDQDGRAEAARRYLPEAESALRRLTLSNSRRPTRTAAEAAALLFWLAGHFTAEFAAVDSMAEVSTDLATLHNRRRQNSDGGYEAAKTKKTKIEARDLEIRRLNGEIRDPKLSALARAKMIAPKIAEWKNAKDADEPRDGVGISERIIRGVIAASRK